MEELVRVEVITSPTKLNGFKKAISKIGVTGMTVSQVMGCGVQKGTPEYEDEIHDEIELLPKQMIITDCTDKKTIFLAISIENNGAMS